MQKTFGLISIFFNLIVLISLAMGDAFDETVTEIQNLATTLEGTRAAIEQELIELRENHPLNAPKDIFESDADYHNRLSELDVIVAEHREASLLQISDIQSQISALSRRVFLTEDITGTLGTYDANNELFPITFEITGRRIETRLSVKKADAKMLFDNWEKVRITGGIAIDPGYRRGLARLNLEYPSLWKDGVMWELNEVYHLGNNKLSVAFSPDGRYLATGDNDWQAIIWKLSTGQSIWQMEHNGDVWAVAFSPDGKYLATGNGNHGWANTGNRAAIWEVRNGTLYQQMAAGEAVNAIAFSPDGRYIAIARGTGGLRSGDALIWDISNATTVQQVENLRVKAVAFSPDGKYFATGNIDGEAFIWEVSSDQPRQQMEHRWDVNAITFSRDGKYVTTGSTEGKVSIWEVSSGQRLRQIDHRGELNAVAYSPDGKYLAAGGEDQVITLYRIGTAEITLETEITKEKSIHTGREVRDLAWSPYGNLISDGNRVYRTLLNPETHELKSETVAEPAQASVTFTIPTTVSVDERFTVSVNVADVTGLSGCQFDLLFNADVLEVKDINEGDFLSDSGEPVYIRVENIDNEKGEVTNINLARKNKGGADGTGTLLKVTFRAKAVGGSLLTLSNLQLGNLRGQIIPSAVTNVRVAVKPGPDVEGNGKTVKPSPDVNGDSKVDILDLVHVSKHLGTAASDAPGVDVNADGKIDILDLIIVSQYL